MSLQERILQKEIFQKRLTDTLNTRSTQSTLFRHFLGLRTKFKHRVMLTNTIT